MFDRFSLWPIGFRIPWQPAVDGIDSKRKQFVEHRIKGR